ncbi:MAG: NADP-dependent 3-hydroxy acid dehydrogenase YdfG [Acidimicrobiales bacterium]|jgi:NADP-dependent 3-hydroxy acid dehydrogenase YdfG
MLSTADRVVMVSGAARGLGRAIANQLHSDGFSLSLGARDLSALEAMIDGWSSCSVHYFDATNPASQQQWVTETVAEHGRIDGLVNNAGIIAPFDLESFQEDGLDVMWEVNVKTPARLAHLTLPHLCRSDNGRVINMASMSGVRVNGGFEPGYAMTKHAVVALTHHIRQQFWADGVRATAVCPSFVDTEMIAHLDCGDEEIISPDDLATLISTMLQLPNSASVAELVVNCRVEPSY